MKRRKRGEFFWVDGSTAQLPARARR